MGRRPLLILPGCCNIYVREHACSDVLQNRPDCMVESVRKEGYGRRRLAVEKDRGAIGSRARFEALE